jgi:hypothetical protein
MKYLALAFALLSSSADASTRSYASPADQGMPISTCLADGTSCGKIVADAFCKKAGFAESILFAREKATSVRILDSGSMCEGETCETFRRIKCYQPEAQAAK